jgi:hypothetical protein
MNRHLPEAATVVHLPYQEIASARRHLDTWTTPSEPTSLSGRYWKLESVELSLASGDTLEIGRALADERGCRGGVRSTHQAVTVPTAGVVRIGWRGHGNDAVPSLTRVLGELNRRVKVLEPTRTDRGDWCKLSDAELDELVAQLGRSGDNLEAVQLLIQRCGYTWAEADKFVEEQTKRT